MKYIKLFEDIYTQKPKLSKFGIIYNLLEEKLKTLGLKCYNFPSFSNQTFRISSNLLDIPGILTLKQKKIISYANTMGFDD